MNSAAELKRFNSNQAFLQAKDKITEALVNDPLGLSVSQLMTVCKLSIKTVKEVVMGTDFRSEDGVFFLENQVKHEPAVVNIKQEKVTVAPEKVTIAEQKSDQKEVQTPTYAQRVRDMFRDNPKGVTLEEALNILGGDRSKFDGQLSFIRKSSFNVSLVKSVDGTKKYMPDFSVKEEVGQLANSETEWKDFCESPKDTLSKYKQKINTVITKKSQLSLDAKELAELLKEVLGFENINFWVDHGELTGVYLSSETVHN